MGNNKHKLSKDKFEYVSERGLETLHERLDSHKAERSALRTRLVELRQLKDVEDFDLIDDTLRLAFLEKEIERTQDMIAHCKLLPAAPGDGTVQIGSRVRLQPAGSSDTEISCILVSSFEADPLEGKISDKSPLGIALLGKMKNAIVKVAGPHKNFSYRILGINYMVSRS